VRPQSRGGRAKPETGCLTRITTHESLLYSLASFEIAAPAYPVQKGDTASESRPQIRKFASATALPYAPKPRTDLHMGAGISGRQTDVTDLTALAYVLYMYIYMYVQLGYTPGTSKFPDVQSFST